MTNYEKIKNMSVEELADFLIIPGEITEVDEDIDGNTYTYTDYCYYTPIETFPRWFTEVDVKEEMIDWLNKDCEENISE